MADYHSHISPFQRIWNLVRLEKKNVRFLYIYAILSGAISLVLPLGIQAIVGLVLAGRLSSSWFILIMLISVAILIAGLARLAQISILETIQRKLFVRVAFDFSHKLAASKELLSKYPSLVELSEKFLDVITVQKSFSKLLLDFTASVLQLLFGLILLSLYHPTFLVFGAILTALLMLSLRITWNRGVNSARSESNYKFKTAYWLTEIAQNRVTFNLKSEQKYHLKRIDEYLHLYVKSRIEHFRVLYTNAGIAIAIKVILTLAMLTLGSTLLVRNDISLGQFLAAEILIISLTDAVEKLVITVENVYDSGIAMEKLGSVTDTEVDSDNRSTVRLSSDLSKAPSVNIVPMGENKPAAAIHPGEKIAICGLPGYGRTRILKAIIAESHGGFTAQLNDIPVENINKEDLGSLTGMCLQGSNIFEGTLAQNIVLAKEPETEELTRISKLLNLHQYITGLEKGFQHYFEANNGIPHNISKKIPLARALYQSPPLILIDDIWTSFTKDEIFDILKYIKTLDSTVILISNHLPVLESVDRCFFLGDHGLKELGRVDQQRIPSEIQNIIWK